MELFKRMIEAGLKLTVGTTELVHSVHEAFMELRSPSKARLRVRGAEFARHDVGAIQRGPVLIRHGLRSVRNQSGTGVLLHLIHGQPSRKNTKTRAYSYY